MRIITQTDLKKFKHWNGSPAIKDMRCTHCHQEATHLMLFEEVQALGADHIYEPRLCRACAYQIWADLTRAAYPSDGQPPRHPAPAVDPCQQGGM